MRFILGLSVIGMLLLSGCAENSKIKNESSKEVKEKINRMGYSGNWIMDNTVTIKNFFDLSTKPRGNVVIFDTAIKEKKGYAQFLYGTEKYEFNIKEVKDNDFELVYNKNRLIVHLKKYPGYENKIYIYIITGSNRSKIENRYYDGICDIKAYKDLDETIKFLREESEIAEIEEEVVKHGGFESQKKK